MNLAVLHSAPVHADRPWWRPEWMQSAACFGHRRSKFYPERQKTETARRHVTEAAKLVCLRCPVRADCLQWAHDMEVAADRRYTVEDTKAGIVSMPVPNRYRYGVFGGLDPQERVRMVDERWSLTDALLFTELQLLGTLKEVAS